LAPGGLLALSWYNDRIDDAVQQQTMLDVFTEFAPTIVVRDEPPEPQGLFNRWPGDELREARESWRRAYTILEEIGEAKAEDARTRLAQSR
jgi:hypothetical protein